MTNIVVRQFGLFFMSISNEQKKETYYIMNICNKSQFYKYY